ncbi:VOC family protein [Sphingobium sp.]|uniref:VOC family protein n=1 Tax=Sphingobium sp. TaxID=1912891 RepID=UPI0028BE6B2B|nr:VOC family protein [Sphingobium sp.]
MAPRLTHIVLQTEDIPRLRDWYNHVLDAHVVYEDDNICFITYDHEHHRIAFINNGLIRKLSGAEAVEDSAGHVVRSGLNHFAYALESHTALADNYDRLKGAGIVPYWCIDHGPATAMYYKDPDGNSMEFQVDNFTTSEECQNYMRSQAFRDNPIGVEYDPEAFRNRANIDSDAAETAETVGDR